jgi:hypothetical protein
MAAHPDRLADLGLRLVAPRPVDRHQMRVHELGGGADVAALVDARGTRRRRP